MKVTFYQILTVSQDADDAQIKLAYRKQSGKYHPDRNKSPNATLFMQVVNEAYACLSDASKRRAYDLTLKWQQPKSQDNTNPYTRSSNTDYYSWDEALRKAKANEKARQEKNKDEQKEADKKSKEFWAKYDAESKAKQKSSYYDHVTPESKKGWDDFDAEEYMSRWETYEADEECESKTKKDLLDEIAELKEQLKKYMKSMVK